MAQKLGFWNQWLWGQWADREAINRNADVLSGVESDVSALRMLVQQQAQEILQLRAMFMGMAHVLASKGQLDDAELEHAVKDAWDELSPPPITPPEISGDGHPYRGGGPTEPSEADIAAAKALLATAQDHHFSKRFPDARAAYQQIVDQYGNTKQAMTARQQLDNLRKT